MRVKMSKQSPPTPTASEVGPCPTVIQIVDASALENTVELQWVEQLWKHANIFETGIVQYIVWPGFSNCPIVEYAHHGTVHANFCVSLNLIYPSEPATFVQRVVVVQTSLVHWDKTDLKLTRVFLTCVSDILLIFISLWDSMRL